MKVMKEFGYDKHRFVQDLIKHLREFLAKILIDLKLLTIFAKRFPF